MTKVCTWFYKPICIYTFCCSICFCSNSWVFFWSSNFFLVISAFCCCCWWSCFLWRGWVGPLALTGGWWGGRGGRLMASLSQWRMRGYEEVQKK